MRLQNPNPMRLLNASSNQAYWKESKQRKLHSTSMEEKPLGSRKLFIFWQTSIFGLGPPPLSHQIIWHLDAFEVGGGVPTMNVHTHNEVAKFESGVTSCKSHRKTWQFDRNKKLWQKRTSAKFIALSPQVNRTVTFSLTLASSPTEK